MKTAQKKRWQNTTKIANNNRRIIVSRGHALFEVQLRRKKRNYDGRKPGGNLNKAATEKTDPVKSIRRIA